MTNRKGSSGAAALPDWWQREKHRRQIRILIFLVLFLALIGYYYWSDSRGVIGAQPAVNFDTSNHIAFVRQDAEGRTTLYAIRADGNDLRRLSAPEDTSDKATPVWTMDGKSLLYSSNRKDGKVTQIYILGNGEARQLTYGAGNKFTPIVNPAGEEAGFITQGAVKTVNLNGTEVYQRMPLPRSGNESTDDQSGTTGATQFSGPFLSAQFSSDGQGIAGIQDISNEPTLNGIAAPPGDQAAIAIPPNAVRSLALETGHEVSLAWEPNGKRLACAFTELRARGEQGAPQLISGIRIWSFDSQGKSVGQPIPVFAGIGYSIEPKNIVWSPDGAHLAMEIWRLKSNGEREPRGLFLLNTTAHGIIVDAAHCEKLNLLVRATKNGAPQHPRWSPDGQRLCYELVRPNGKRDLWVINTDGTNAINLTNGDGDNSDACWSPLQ